MRRVPAILVLLVFGGMLLAPMAAGLGPALPICCRPGGAHHCTGMTAQAPRGDGFRDAHQCPYSHATLLPSSLRPEAPAAVPAPHGTHALGPQPSRVQPAAPAAGLQSPRAPPALFSL